MTAIRPLSTLLALALLLGTAAAQDIIPIPRRLPPKGVELPAGERARLEQAVRQLGERLAKAGDAPLLADVAVFHKALDLALRHGEFYDAKKDVPKADWALAQANQRLEQLRAAPWAKESGLVVRGYTSVIDGSVQPYGLVIPAGLDRGRPAPLYVWLHGRGDSNTDLHFLWDRSRGKGEVHPDTAIVLHPFGRHCVGFKSAGERDVFEAIAHVQANYRIDPERIVLMGFSMGGAGAKHIGAHYTDRFAAVHAGAGFAETSRYLGLKATDVPPYEATLWGLYDVPHYVRNLFNVPFTCYSGDKDKQIQAAQVLEESFKEHGQVLTHIVGPDTGHSYHAESLKQVLALVQQAVGRGRPAAPERLSFQTRTLRYPGLHWVEALGLDEHWQDARIDAQATAAGVELTTRNISSLRLSWPKLRNGSVVSIDGATLKLAGVGAKPKPGQAAAQILVKSDGVWKQAPEPPTGLRKKPGLQGPIDDAFMDPFLVVLPSGRSPRPRFQRWVESESKHALERWTALMRGAARVKLDKDVGEEDIRRYHLVLWGDPASNALIARIADRLPLTWDGETLRLGERSFAAADHAPLLIHPNPLNPALYVVLNSGLTFREAHDKTNSQQNPKLPDWAVIGLDRDPDEQSPGRVADAGFFDEQWRVRAK